LAFKPAHSGDCFENKSLKNIVTGIDMKDKASVTYEIKKIIGMDKTLEINQDTITY